MAVDCSDLNALADSAKCILAKTTPEERQAMIVYALTVIAGVSADPDTLAENSKCILAGMSDEQMKAATVQLLCAIVNL